MQKVSERLTFGDTIRVLQSRLALRRAAIAKAEQKIQDIKDSIAAHFNHYGQGYRMMPDFEIMVNKKRYLRGVVRALSIDQRVDRALKLFLKRFLENAVVT